MVRFKVQCEKKVVKKWVKVTKKQTSQSGYGKKKGWIMEGRYRKEEEKRII